VLPRSALLTLLFGLVACDSQQRPNPVLEALAQAPPGSGDGASVVFRFPITGEQDAKLYQLPGLGEVAWRFEAGDHSVASTVGFASDDDLAYTLTGDHELVALDLASGRARVVDTSVAIATLGPTGTPYVVHLDGSVATVQRRTATPWPNGFATVPTQLWGAARNRLVAVVSGEEGPVLTLLASGQEPITQHMPDGGVAVSRWGDVAVVTTDSGLEILDPLGATARRFVPLNIVPLGAAFSPAAHHVYAVGAMGTLVVVDRFALELLDTLALPGAGRGLRSDPTGRVLLVQPEAGGEVWVVDLVEWQLAATLPGEWDENLPAVAPDGTILARRDDSVVALTAGSWTAAGEAEDADGDRWLAIAWDPRRPALEFGAVTPEVAQDTSQIVYVQVSSTSNRDWADDLASNLRRAGMEASVLEPQEFGEPYRVVLGPYSTREEAEATGRRLGLPYWIFTPDTTSAQP
jgi:DNA-binding beta-propeller fold protein YncE